MMQQAAGLATRSRKRQRIGVAQCFAAARVLIEDDQAWADFSHKLQADLQLQPKAINRSDALRLALLSAVGETGKDVRKQVSRFYRAVRPFFDSGVSARELPDLIKAKGGFQRLASANATKRGTSKEDQTDGGQPGSGSESVERKTGNPIPTGGRRNDPNDNSNDDEIADKQGTDGARSTSLVLEGPLEGEGNALLNFSLPCFASFCAHIDRVRNGGFVMQIFYAQEVD
jgi:hypothetical protein